MNLVRMASWSPLLPLFFVCLCFAGNNPDQSGADLLEHAATLQGIRDHGSQPFQLRMRIHAEHIVARPMDGSYAEVWMAPDKWRREIGFPGFSQLEIGDADSKWMARDLDFRPRVAYLTAMAIETFMWPHIDGETIKSVRGKKIKGVELSCVDVANKGETYPRGLCFDSSGVLVNEAYGQERFEYGDFSTFGGKLFPKSIRVYEQDNKVLEINADALTAPADSRPELFQHTTTAHRMASCERWYVVPGTKVAPQYPESARAAHQQGTVILYLLLSGRGEVEKTSVLQSAGRALDQSATEAVKRWVYSPIKCGPVPLETEIEVSVNYELR